MRASCNRPPAPLTGTFLRGGRSTCTHYRCSLRVLPSPLRGGVGGGGNKARDAARVFTPPLTPPRQGEGNPVEQAPCKHHGSSSTHRGSPSGFSNSEPKLLEDHAQGARLSRGALGSGGA